MKQYLDILYNVYYNGKSKPSRTSINTRSITGSMFEHDMSTGFPLLTTKKMGMKNIACELEFFIKGLSNKQWLKDRNCNIWNEWCNPEKVPYGTDAHTQNLMAVESDLGRVYGVQWRDWDSKIDQLSGVLNTLLTNPTDRGMICTAWNPSELHKMALRPCHYGFQLLSDGESVDLLWSQRSVDVPLGLPYNIASYGLLLTLIAKTVGMVPGKLIGFLADCHIYDNQLPGVVEHLRRGVDSNLPTLSLSDDFTSLFDWDYTQFTLSNYNPQGKISMPIAI